MNKKTKITSLTLIFFILLLPEASFALDGDILYQNCVTETCAGAGSSSGWLRTVESLGCVSGECLKLTASPNGSLYGAGNTAIGTASVIGKDEITVYYWIKFNKSARDIAGGNIKAFRPLTGSSYYFATMNSHFGDDYYSSVNTGPMIITDKVTSVHIGYGYSELIEGNNYYNPDGRFEFNFTAGGQSGFGAYWTNVRHWIKMPTTLGGSDGESKIWINDELVATFINQSADENASTTFSGFTFYPSSEATEPFEHWMDEMVIFEGYVPPDGDFINPPTGLNVI
ncbi:MAG: hypothetical protein V3574_05705 [Candidatus Moraniibacteriota bacterium]